MTKARVDMRMDAELLATIELGRGERTRTDWIEDACRERLADLESDGRFNLYRLYDADGSLLYVGVTQNLRQRFRLHVIGSERSPAKEWWGTVALVTLENHADQQAAWDAERGAIENERPLHNHLNDKGGGGRPPSSDPKLPITIRLRASTLEAIAKAASAKGRNQRQHLETAVERTFGKES